MGATALAVLLIVGVSLVAWHFTKQEPLIGAFSSDQIQVGGLYEFDKNDGCNGKMIVVPKFRKANLVKVDTNGFSKHWEIRVNKKKDKARTTFIKIEGTCCWVITDRHGETQDFGLGDEKEPRISYIKTIKTTKCT